MIPSFFTPHFFSSLPQLTSLYTNVDYTPLPFSESAYGLLKPWFFPLVCKSFFLSKLLFAHAHFTMAQQPNLCNIFRINLAPHAN